jgi:ABC-type uncharacterized transport system substrate-binding protein
MKRKITVLTLCAMLFALCLPAGAQQPNKIPRIGYLTAGSLSAQSAGIKAFRQGLREFGYVEGKNIVIEWRSAEGKLDRLPALAAELVHLRVDVIVTAGPIPTRSAKEATVTIPIVMTQDTDPVGNGFVASLARPGGNISGLATLRPEPSGKQLELLKAGQQASGGEGMALRGQVRWIALPRREGFHLNRRNLHAPFSQTSSILSQSQNRYC